jgi:orotate phosphoribosyltransferase
VKDSGLEFDVIFGPAYKGIPLVTAFSIAWYELFGESKDICYNRKEAKDHGEVNYLNIHFFLIFLFNHHVFVREVC